MSSSSILLRNLLVETKDGEWGQAEPFDGSVEMAVIRGTDFDTAKKNHLIGVPVRHIAGKAAGRKTLQPFDILIETAGGSKGKPTGKTTFLRPALFERSKLPITCASFARFLRIDATRADPEFVYWYLQCLYLNGVIENYQVQHTGIARFQFTKFADSLEIDLPPVDDQMQVSAFLGSIEDRIALLRETNATLEAIAQALFKSWFVDFDPVCAKAEGLDPEGMDAATAALFPDSFEESELGLVPTGWQMLPLEDAYEINPKRKLKKGEMAPYLDMASVGTQGHVVSGVIEREMGSGTKFINGDTLLARITPCLENGKSAFVDFLSVDQTGWGSTEFVVLRPRAPLPPYHGYLLARHSAFREHAIQSMSGTSGRQRVQNDVLGRFPVVVPSQDIAEAFGDVVGRAQQKIAANQEQAKTLTQLRDTLLPRLISGQLRIPKMEASVENILSEAV